MRLSHSQMETWQQCELKWALGKVYHAPAAPSDALILGTAFHAALEADGRAWIADRRRMTRDELVAVFHAALDAERAASDPDDLLADQVSTMRRRGVAMIAAYVRDVQPHLAPEAVEIEVGFTLDNDLTFTGRVDAVTARAVVDWKTASRPWARDAAEHKDQASAYLIAYPARSRVVFVVFACDPEAPDVCAAQTHVATRTEEQLAAYRAQVAQVADAIADARRRNVYVARPTPLCGWCGYLGSCALGRAWLDAAGRVARVPVIASDINPINS